jgi:hypothetical protein
MSAQTNEPGFLALTTVGTLDPEGLQQDMDFLAEDKWLLTTNSTAEAVWEKGGGALQLTVRPSADNPHRVIWEMAVHAKATRLGYASDIYRPGDLSTKKIIELIKRAIKAGEDELHTWEDALAEARRQIGI